LSEFKIGIEDMNAHKLLATLSDAKKEIRCEDLKLDEAAFNNLSDDDFLLKIVSSETIAQSVLQSISLKARLNKIAEKKESQIFPNSCTANCILKLLVDFNILEKSQCDGVKELEVYLLTWSKPGDVSDPQRIVSYLKSQGVDVSLVEVKERINAFLKVVPEEISASYQAIKKLTAFNSSAELDEKQVAEISDPGLLFSICVHGIHIHTLFGAKNETRYQVTFPAHGAKEERVDYASFQEFYKLTPSFTGLMFAFKKKAKSAEEAAKITLAMN
jgi:hypothetical protein